MFLIRRQRAHGLDAVKSRGRAGVVEARHGAGTGGRRNKSQAVVNQTCVVRFAVFYRQYNRCGTFSQVRLAAVPSDAKLLVVLSCQAAMNGGALKRRFMSGMSL